MKPKILLFLDAQGKQYIESFQLMLESFNLLIIYVSYGLDKDDINDNAILVDDQQCVTLSKYFKVLHPLGGGVYPINHLTIISNDLVRVEMPLRLNAFNPHEKFGLSINDLISFLDETIAFL